MVVTDSLIGEIVSRVLTVVEPDQVILFGSAASGRMNADSDIDLLIIAAPKYNTLDQRLKILQSLRGLGFAFDVFIMEPGRFEQTKNVFGGLAYPAYKHGRVIYEARR